MPLLTRGVPLHLSPTAVRAINSRQMSGMGVSIIRRCLLNVRVSPRKRTSIRDLAILHGCQTRTSDGT
jgi:hypothetical protein